MERLRSPGFATGLVWGSALVLIAGVVAFVTVRSRQEDLAAGRRTRRACRPATLGGPPGVDTQTTPKESDVPKAAREAAGEFVLAAVGPGGPPKAWKLADQDLRASCACTCKQWLTGNIPVQYFPTKGLEGAAFSVDEVTPGHVMLQVLLTPGKNKDGPRPTEFYIGLRQRSKNGPWRVDYWAPVNVVAVPAAPGGGGADG